MKKTLITALILAASITAHAQQIDTNKKVKLNQREIWQIHGGLNAAIQKIHKIEMSSLKRDTLDSMLLGITQYIEQKYNHAVADSIKKTANKPKP